MIITAKFASTCPVCRRAISVGSKVEWSKGAKACCPACAGRAPVMQAAPARPRLAAVRAAMGGGRRTGCSCGSVEGASRDGDCWTCRHDA
jgi:hypothetical protein